MSGVLGTLYSIVGLAALGQPASYQCGSVISVSSGRGSHSKRVAMIREPFRDDVIRAPLKLDGPALPGAQEWNPSSLKGREGVGGSRGRCPLADHHGSQSRPGVTPYPVVIRTPPLGDVQRWWRARGAPTTESGRLNRYRAWAGEIKMNLLLEWIVRS